MKTARNRKRDTITTRINAEIQTALRDMGVSESLVSKVPNMSADELYDTARKANADPYLG